jgi:hypothetical protein
MTSPHTVQPWFSAVTRLMRPTEEFMPYHEDLPDSVASHLPPHAQDIFRAGV